MSKIGFVLILASFAALANTNDFLQATRAHGNLMQSKINTSELEKIRRNSEALSMGEQSLIERLKAQARQSSNKNDQVVDTMLFVSFSMPKSLLFGLADEASHYGIGLIIKGLKEDDFKKTVDTFYKLNQKASKERLNFEGISIDPFWFQELHIEKVPALVVIERPGACMPHTPCPSQKFDVVYGNSKVIDSLKLIAQKGELRGVAQKILDEHHV